MEPISDFSQARVAIVGLGLMGGSLAAALKTARACRKVIGVARRQNSITTAAMLQFIDRGTTDLAAGIQDADLVVLCTPVGDILKKLGEIGPLLKPGAVLLDIGSTKRDICQAMDALPEHVEPVGGHPMCGKETSGLTMAEPGLFRDRVFVLIPLARTSARAERMASQLVSAVGARELRLEAERHDDIVAAISHLPYLLSATLVNAASALAGEDPMPWRLAAGGFRDTSRVAGGSVAMMMDILMTNRDAVLNAGRVAQKQLAEMMSLLERGEYDALECLMEQARATRNDVIR